LNNLCAMSFCDQERIVANDSMKWKLWGEEFI